MTGGTPRPFGPPMSPADADRVMRSPDLGWPAGTIDEAREVRHAALREGLHPMPAPACDGCQAALRRARVAGLLQGLMLAVIAHLVGVILLALIDAHWPVACDGTATLGACAARLMGVA